MANYFDIQDNPNDPPLSHYMIYAVTGAIINPLSSLIGFIFFGLLDLLLTAIGVAPETSFFSFVLGYIWVIPLCVIPQSLFGALSSFIIGLVYGKRRVNQSKTPKQKLQFNVLVASILGILVPVMTYTFFFISGKVLGVVDLFVK